MARIVMKFGGTSMAGIERIRHVAGLVKREVDSGNQAAVVVSAMAGETDRLVQLCREAAALYDPREYDVVVASGEQVTAGLLAITLQGMGVNARSYMGWQLPIRASGHSAALIDHIEAEILEGVFSRGGIAVIPGFQGITPEGDLATLGRGGSDTSAVALAVAMNADRCDIYTDVEGVFTTDPRIVPRARKLQAITYEEMLELASVGAKVLQTRSVGLAMRYNMPLQVLSSFEDRPGTLIVGDDRIEELKMERQLVTGIAHDKNEARITLSGLPDKAGHGRRHFRPAGEGRNQRRHDRPERPHAGEKSDLTFTVATASLAHAVAEIEKAKENRLRRHLERYRRGEDQRGGHWNALQRRDRGQDVRDSRRARDQHPRHLHLGDQGLGAGPGGIYRACGAGASLRLRTRRGGSRGMSGEGLIPEQRPVHPGAGHARLKQLMHRGVEFLGCEWAIMGGAMSWVSERNLVAAISNAGGFGVIACGAMGPSFSTPRSPRPRRAPTSRSGST
jgi:aspartate kinase